MKKLLVWYEKGGTGKTTVAYNLASGLHRQGKKILLVDIDPSAGATKHAGLSPGELNHSLSELLFLVMAHQNFPLADYLYPTEDGFPILPATAMLEVQASMIKSVFGEEARDILSNVLGEAATEYDYIIFDGSPSKSIYNLSALSMADQIIMPMRANFLDFQCLEEALTTIKGMQEWNSNLDSVNILLTQYKKTKHAELVQEALEELEAEGVNLLPMHISYGIDLVEASLQGKSIFLYKSWSKQAQEFMKLLEAIMNE